MKAKVAVLLVAPALAMSLVIQWQRASDRILASVLLRQVEARTMHAVATGALSETLLREHLQVLRRAAELDDSQVGIPIARGSQYLLLRRPEAAADAYRQALALEARPEIYLNLGRALVAMGRTEEATEMFGIAIQLSPGVRFEVPESFGGSAP